jgi:tetratricopeptide (TPR) repeat protein
MERLLKYCLSTICFALFLSCKEKSIPATFAERKIIAKGFYDIENEKHGFDFIFQGTPKGMTLLDDILEIDSTNAEVLRAISVPYLKRGMPHKWKPWFDKAVAHDPVTWQPWRGYLYLWFYRDYEKAIADFNASDTLTPYLDYPQGHSVDFWWGIAYLGLKDYENSIVYWDKHITKETEDTGEDWVELEAFLYRGIAYFEWGKADKAIENFDKAIHYFKQSADSKYYKALILKDQGKNKEALTLVEAAILDFNTGFYNNRDYVETLRQIYRGDLEDLKDSLTK